MSNEQERIRIRAARYVPSKRYKEKIEMKLNNLPKRNTANGESTEKLQWDQVYSPVPDSFGDKLVRTLQNIKGLSMARKKANRKKR